MEKFNLINQISGKKYHHDNLILFWISSISDGNPKDGCYLLPQIPKDVLFALCMPGRELATGT